jgi:hypothetical protein
LESEKSFFFLLNKEHFRICTVHQLMQVRPRPSRVEHFSGAAFKGRLLALPANITPGWEGLSGTKALLSFGPFVNIGQVDLENAHESK